jgi:hypothetical protein
MFEDATITAKETKKSEGELLRELADLVATKHRDDKFGFKTFGQEDRIKGILSNLGYAVA